MAYYNLDRPAAPRQFGLLGSQKGSPGKVRKKLRRAEKQRRRERMRALLERGQLRRSAAHWGCLAIPVTLLVMQLIVHGFGIRIYGLRAAAAFLTPFAVAWMTYLLRLWWLLRHAPPPRSVAAIPDVDHEDDPVDDVEVEATPESPETDTPIGSAAIVRTQLGDDERDQRRRMMKRRVGTVTNPDVAAGMLFLLMAFLGAVIGTFMGGRSTRGDTWMGWSPMALTITGLAVGMVLGGIGAMLILRDQPIPWRKPDGAIAQPARPGRRPHKRRS